MEKMLKFIKAFTSENREKFAKVILLYILPFLYFSFEVVLICKEIHEVDVGL